MSRRPLTLEQFIERSNKVHNNKYQYVKSIYTVMDKKIIITCPIHGDFEQTPHNHLNKNGCKVCWQESKRSKLEDFISQASLVHEGKYSYEKSKYINAGKKLIITCKQHGDFTAKPTNHLGKKSGCPICKASKGELAIKAILDKHDINYEPQYKLPEIVANYEIDFYLPEYRLLIEFHGIQHFKYIPFFHKNDEDNFLKQKDRDTIIRDAAIRWKYNYLEFNYKQFETYTEEDFKKLVIKNLDRFTKLQR